MRDGAATLPGCMGYPSPLLVLLVCFAAGLGLGFARSNCYASLVESQDNGRGITHVEL